MKRATTSASNVFRRRLCIGSANAEKDLAEKESEYSGEGTMLHELYYTGKRPEHLTEEQASTLDLADLYTDEFFTNVRNAYDIPEDAKFVDEREVSLEYRNAAGEVILPGHADLIRTWPKYKVRAIADAKFGFMTVDSAADNDQLASYAVCRQQAGKAKALGVAIVQPRNFGPRLSQAIYTAEAIDAAAADIEAVILASQKPDAPRTPGDKQCHFCKARTTCPERSALFLDISPADVYPLAVIPADDLEKLHVAIAFAAKIGDEVKDEMRRRVEAGEMPGWNLRNTGDDVKLIDASAFFAALKERFGNELTARAFDACREMQWGKLTALLMSVAKLSEKKTKELIGAFADGLVTRTPKKMSVVRDKDYTPRLDS